MDCSFLRAVWPGGRSPRVIILLLGFPGWTHGFQPGAGWLPLFMAGEGSFVTPGPGMLQVVFLPFDLSYIFEQLNSLMKWPVDVIHHMIVSCHSGGDNFFGGGENNFFRVIPALNNLFISSICKVASEMYRAMDCIHKQD